MKSMEDVLQIIGNETRRKILTLLSKEPHYISQIAKKLDVTQPAVLKHLSVLEKAGLIESFPRKNPQGGARKYYRICDSVGLEVAINPQSFKVARRPRRMNCSKHLETERIIRRLTEEINSTQDASLKVVKAQKLSQIADLLLSCRDYNEGNWDCENCRSVAYLRKDASQIILNVAQGDIESGIRRLTETVNRLMSGLLPK